MPQSPASAQGIPKMRLSSETLTKALIEEKYSKETEYTYISATPAVSNGGAGVFTGSPDGQTELLAVLTGKRCCNYGAEVQALQIVASALQIASSICHQLVYLTDVLVLSLLEVMSNKMEPQLMDLSYTVSTTRRF